MPFPHHADGALDSELREIQHPLLLNRELLTNYAHFEPDFQQHLDF